MRIGFVTWDGPDQNYMESLFLPIFARIAGEDPDLTFSTLQFTWDFDTTSIVRASGKLGFGYEDVAVLRRPLTPATALMIAIGARRVVRFCTEHRIDVLMPRSIICAAMVLLARRSLPGIRVVFDADGFVADERVDFAGWSAEGLTYRLFRDIEAQMSRIADSVIVRTDRAREILLARVGAGIEPNKVIVVSNGKDEDLFRPFDADERRAVRNQSGVPVDAPWVVYAGSIGPQYHPDEMLRFFELVEQRCAPAHFLVLTGQIDAMKHRVTERGLEDRVTVQRVPPDEVPAYLASADVGLALREPRFSQQGVAPIKVGEYLLTGLPVVATSGVGDIDDQLDDRVGFLLEELGEDSLSAAAEWFVDDVLGDREGFRTRCRELSLAEFGMTACADRYREAIQYAVFGER